MKMIKLALATLLMAHTTHAADIAVMPFQEPGPMLHMHSRGVLCQTTQAQQHNIENDGFNFSDLTEHAMKTLHTSLQTCDVLHRCAVFQEDLKEKRRLAVDDHVLAKKLQNDFEKLQEPIHIIQNFAHNYPYLQGIKPKQEESEKCIESIKAINILTFPYFMSHLS